MTTITTTTENTVRLTNKTALQYAQALVNGAKPAYDFNPAEVSEKLSKMMEQLDKKNAGPKKMTKTQEANEVVKECIVKFLTANRGNGFTCADLIKHIPELEGKSNQYVSALMKLLKDAGRVEKYTDKRRAYFKAVIAD